MPSYESTTRRMREDQPGLCALIQDALPFYLENELSPEARAFVDTHLETCDRCASFLAGAQSVRGQVRRETAQRAGTLDGDWRAQQAISRGRRRLLIYAFAFVGAVSSLVVMCAILGFMPGSAVTQPTALEPPIPGESYIMPTVVPPGPTPTPIPYEGVAPGIPIVTPPMSPSAMLPTVTPMQTPVTGGAPVHPTGPAPSPTSTPVPEP
jgi:hypothetical protein